MGNIFFELKQIKYLGEDSIIGRTVRIRKPEEVTIGEHTIIDDFTYISCALEIGVFSHIASNVDISGSAKLKINRTVNGKIPELAKANFQKMFIEDRMYGALPDIDSWMRLSWAKLNRFAKINNG